MPGSWRALSFSYPREILDNVYQGAAEPSKASDVTSEAPDWGIDSSEWGEVEVVSSLEQRLPYAEGDARDQPDIHPGHSQPDRAALVRQDSQEPNTGCILKSESQQASQHSSSFNELVGKLDSALQINDQKPARAGNQQKQSLDSEPQKCTESIQFDDQTLTLPEFCLWQQAEPSDQRSHVAGKDQQHINELLAAYQQEEVQMQPLHHRSTPRSEMQC